MDFYNALKNGTTIGELTKAFNDAIKDAQNRIAADQEKEKAKAEKAKALEDARSKVAKSLTTYINLLLSSSQASQKEIETVLKNFESDYKNIKSLKDILSSTDKKPWTLKFFNDKPYTDITFDNFFKDLI